MAAMSRSSSGEATDVGIGTSLKLHASSQTMTELCIQGLYLLH